MLLNNNKYITMYTCRSKPLLTLATANSASQKIVLCCMKSYEIVLLAGGLKNFRGRYVKEWNSLININNPSLSHQTKKKKVGQA